MSALNEIIVREFFEQHGFLVSQQRKHTLRAAVDDEPGVDFLVVNPQPPETPGPVPFLLTAADMPLVQRGIVVVKAWHTENFGPSRITQGRKFRFVSPADLKQAVRALGEGPITRILVIPALPAEEEPRRQSVELLKANGVEAVLPFHTILSSLIAHVEVNRDYQKSDLLQVLRILKNYDLLREPQLELFKARRTRAVSADPGR
jgi:nucleoid-associated protein YgaU